MLIRICDHFKDNPKRIDKLIAIKGLPDEWFFREGTAGRELKRPWQADIDANIPIDVRSFCDPMYVIFRYPPITQGAKEVIEKRQILGVKIDYNTEPGRQMWDDVERYIEESTPRDERVPVAVLCAKDERSGFETYTPRRTTRGSLELIPSPIPSIDLTKYVQVKVEAKVVEPMVGPEEEAAPAPVAPAAEFKCEHCDYKHRSKAGVRMHTMKRHPVNEKVGVS